MADSYFKFYSLCSEFQVAYESVMSNNGSAFTEEVQQHGMVFGLQVDQTAPSNYVNSLIPYGESFHNPLSDSRFKKMPVRVIYSQEYKQSEPLDLSHKPGAYQGVDRNTRILASQPESRIDRVWCMAGESSNPLPAGNELDLTASAAISGESLSTIIDNAHELHEKRKAYQKAYQRAYQRAYQKAYRESEKGKAYRKAYRNTKKGKAVLKAYEQSEKRKSSLRARAQSERSKAYRKVYYRAYRRVFRDTRDNEQARFAGRQAAVSIRELYQAKNNELESTSMLSLHK